MIRQSFSLGQIESVITQFGAELLPDSAISIIPTQRGSVALAATSRGEWVLKYADLQCHETEVVISPPRSEGLHNEAKYLSMLTGVIGPRLIEYDAAVDSVAVITEHISGCSAFEVSRRDVRSRAKLTRGFIGLVSEAHKQGVIHGDIQPGNAVLGPTGRMALIDFEFAHSLDTPAMAPGLYHYMSPEAARKLLEGGKPELDQPEETFALAASCLALLAGRVPINYSEADLPRLEAIGQIADEVGYTVGGVHSSDLETAYLLKGVLESPPEARPQSPQILGKILGVEP